LKDPEHFVEQVNFDREIPLDELLAAADKNNLSAVLDRILQHPYRLIDLTDQTLLGTSTCQNLCRATLILELEPLGYLVSECRDPVLMDLAKRCVLMQIRFAQKYLMASALHIEAIQEDYSSLCKEHQALLASEAKYKTLSEHLDEKVKQQVSTIETTQRKLFESEKLASVGHLAAGVAHEINTPIGFINSNLNTARNYLNELKSICSVIQSGDTLAQVRVAWSDADMNFLIEDFDDLLTDCTDGGKRVAEIVADLKLFSNVDAEEEIAVDLNQYIRTSCNVARASLGREIVFDFDLNAIPPITCRPGYIGQVMLALIMNANDAMTGNGTISIKSYLVDANVVVDIHDDGPGISQTIIDKVFDPFFTTKDVGEGKGLGLTACRDILLAHGGEISIESKQTRGTLVSFCLPVTSPSDFPKEGEHFE